MAEIGVRVNILLVEDDVCMRILTSLMLEKLGHKFKVVTDGLEAIREIQQFDYDVILMDIEMSQMGGLEATRYIRQEVSLKRQPYIIAFTSSVNYERKCYEVGMNDFLQKPCSFERIAVVLSKVCSSRYLDC